MQSFSRRNKRTECALLVLLIVSSTLWGQSTPRLAFDVASIKQAAPGENGGGYTFERGGRTVIQKFTLKNLIMVAWHVQEFQVVVPADWMDSTRYDIEAKAGGNPSNDQSRLMLQSLLLERFHLVVLRESKKLPIFVLRRTGTLRAGLTPVKNPQCTPTDEDFPVDVPGEKPFCRITFRLVKSADSGTSMLVQGTTSISAIERLLSTIVERQVTDQTNLSGVFDLKLEFRPDDFSGRAAPIPGATNSTAPSIFTAVQEQLGLKLVQTKGPVEVLVIDHAEEPTPN